MRFLIAAATNEISSPPANGKISVALDPYSLIWALVFTLLWDLIDLFIRGGHWKFLRTQTFWWYFIFHYGLSILATLALAKSFETTWLIGLIAAVSNETILSNANITFGNASILPLLDKFRAMRAKIDQEVNALTKAQTTKLINKLVAKLSVQELQGHLITLLVQSGKTPNEVNQELANLTAECAGNQQLLKTKLANDFIQLDPVSAKQSAG